MINLLITDVDGTLTDSGMYYDDMGNEWKKFNTRDGKGIELLQEKGIHVMFLTSEDTPIVKRRADKLHVEYCYMGIKDKMSFLNNFFLQQNDFSWDKTAYIGDDINDIFPMKHSKLSATPADGTNQNKIVADYICEHKGGEGCVREFCEYIIKKCEVSYEG